MDGTRLGPDAVAARRRTQSGRSYASRWNHYNPTNASGFGALPGGIQSYYYWLTSDAGIWTSYKGDDSPGYLYLSNMPYIAQSYLYSGMYVRCIKSTNTSDL